MLDSPDQMPGLCLSTYLLELALLPDERGAGIIDFLDLGIMLPDANKKVKK